MEKYEWIPYTWNQETDPALKGFWDLIGHAFVFEGVDKIQATNLFKDPIAHAFLRAAIKRNVNVTEIRVQRQCVEADGGQSASDLQDTINDAKSNPELILKDGSHYAVILAEAEHGFNLWVWDLKKTRCEHDAE